ncbi:Major facilitator superfamily domain, general substrate transporter [Pseudocohnilembus persalinus]|uniref:Major facilitator superfamily domain, general substrate transporter n=1 Tax=Pseudocohnilembus persalinus TaxID=266149 RepID=A0A0V0QHN7_PSEPJ|nr:Major facilitator superfamily domain, general substrate transporter [Pseudocohnilembus persalinus]|eukprot:KRX01759.1 Major facilitator superfamily domain, general substrate transporter [Pseudocohnilembus persalinus]
MEKQAILIISICSIISSLLASIQDVAIDGWVSNLFENEENRGFASSCQSDIQQQNYNNEIIQGPQELQLKLIDPEQIKAFDQQMINQSKKSSIFYNDEYKKYEQTYNQIPSQKTSFQLKEQKAIDEFKDLLKNFKNFYSNQYLFVLCLFLLTFRFGFAPLDVGGYLILIQKGFPKKDWAFFGVIFFPVQILVPFLTGKLILGLNKEMKFILLGLLVKIADTLIFSIAIQYYEGPGDGGLLYYVFGFNLFIQQAVNAYIFVLCGAFIFKIQDESVGGTQVTMLFSLFNFGKYFIEPITLWLLGFIQFFWLVVMGIFYQIVYLQIVEKRILQLDFVHPSNFNLLKKSTDEPVLNDVEFC